MSATSSTSRSLASIPGGSVWRVAGAIASTCRQTGAAFGVAICGSIVAASSSGFVSASHAAWAVLAGCGLATLALGLVSTGRWAQASAARNGKRLAAEEAAASS